MKIIVTGAGGFIGNRLVELAKPQFEVQPLSLRDKQISMLDLSGADTIVHLAGKAHEMQKADEQSYFDINYTFTHDLAERAIAQNVPHFIFISTLKVYGNETDTVLNENSPCHPVDAYGKSKLKAEQYLQSLQPEKLKVAIIRPPLVYGAQVKGNMLRLLELCNKNIPLPFANTKNNRSMVYVDNLVELIFTVIRQKASGIFLAADEYPLSTDTLLSLVQEQLKAKITLINMPGILRYFLKKIKPDLYNRLFRSFVIDNTQTNKLLNFKPPYSTNTGITEMVQWFKTLQTN